MKAAKVFFVALILTASVPTQGPEHMRARVSLTAEQWSQLLNAPASTSTAYSRWVASFQ